MIVSTGSVTDQLIAGTDNYVAGSKLDIAGHIQAGSVMRWRFCLVKTATGTVTPQFIMRFGTGGTVTDTARVSFTGAAQTATIDGAFIDVEAIYRAAGATAVVVSYLKFEHAKGASGFGGTATGPQILVANSTPFDITASPLVAGFSCHPGATGQWVFQIVDAQAVNTV